MELKRIFKFRNLWVGMAMVWIVFFHSGFVLESKLVNLVKDFGFGGVDICLFASGIGCYYSLEKDPDLFRFLKRRAKRLVPAYYCFIIPWMLWKMRGVEFPIWSVVGNLLGIQSLISWDYHFNWYISGLVVYYLALPYLKNITDSLTNFYQDILVLAVLFAIGIPFWYSGNTIIIVSRLPVLYAGIVCAKMAKHGYVLKSRDVGILAFLFVLGVGSLCLCYKFYPGWLWSLGMDWYPFALIVPGLCVFISLVAERMENYKLLNKFNHLLSAVGIYSFEVYLVHVFLYESLMYRILHLFPSISDNLLWLLTIPVIICGTWILNRIAAFVSNLFHQKKHG